MTRRALLFLVFAFGCGGRSETAPLHGPTNLTGLDASVLPDSGPLDRGLPVRVDLGVDMGIDLGVRDRGPRDDGWAEELPLPGADEGEPCRTDDQMLTYPFEQGDCADGLLCAPWDLYSGVDMSALEGPVKSCVKPCEEDRECRGTRRCVASGLEDQTGAARICVDDVAGYDEPCSGSRIDREQMRDPLVDNYLDRIVGCDDGLTCERRAFRSAFNPDESVCVAFCETDADCTHPGLPYCNPRASTDPERGICSDAKHPNGAICGSTDPNKRFQLSTGCDTSMDTCDQREGCPICVQINYDVNNSLTPDGTGICISPCNAQSPCAGARICVPDFFNNGDGVCSDACTAFPESCAEAGLLLNGRDCLGLAGGASFCVDRYAPPLLPSEWNLAGDLTSSGEDCTGAFDDYSFFRCPDGATCVPTDQQGFCVYTCQFADPAYGDVLCRGLLGSMTAACVEPQAGFGVCADD